MERQDWALGNVVLSTLTDLRMVCKWWSRVECREESRHNQGCWEFDFRARLLIKFGCSVYPALVPEEARKVQDTMCCRIRPRC